MIAWTLELSTIFDTFHIQGFIWGVGGGTLSWLPPLIVPTIHTHNMLRVLASCSHQELENFCVLVEIWAVDCASMTFAQPRQTFERLKRCPRLETTVQKLLVNLYTTSTYHCAMIRPSFRV